MPDSHEVVKISLPPMADARVRVVDGAACVLAYCLDVSVGVVVGALGLDYLAVGSLS